MFQGSFALRSLARAATLALVATPVLLLGACGGGGGGSGDAAVAPLSVNLAITSDNAKPVSADALDNGTNVQAAESGSAFVTGVQLGSGAGGSASLQLASAARLLVAKVSSQPQLATGVAINETAPCLSGSLGIAGDVTNPDVISPGDTVTLTANACRESVDGSEVTMNGALRITIVSGSVNTNPAHVVMTMQADGFSVSGNGEVNQASGDMTLDVTVNRTTGAETVVLTGSSLSSSVTTATSSRSFTMQNYRQTVSSTTAGTTYSVDALIGSSNSRLGTGTKVYSLSTPTALVTNSAGAFTAGSLKVTGTSSALLLTVTGTNTFQLQVDANGDGTFESSAPTTLSELRAQL